MAKRTMEEKLSTTSYAILGLLTFDAMSGYDVLKLVEKSIGHFWSPAKSQVYAELRRLARAGLASEEMIQQDPGRTSASTRSPRRDERPWWSG